MSEFDQALAIFQQNPGVQSNQSLFYDLFLNSTFYVPTLDPETAAGEPESEEQQHAVPLILDSGGNDYLMLFDTEERLRHWAQAEVGFVKVPGHVIALTSVPPLHWALNVGAEYSKEFLPDEIAWLREVVEQCNARAPVESE